MRTLKRTPLRWLLPAVSFLCFMSARSSHAQTNSPQITINNHGGSYKIQSQATNNTADPMVKLTIPSPNHWQNAGAVVGQANVTTALTSAAEITLTGTNYLTSGGSIQGSTQYVTSQFIQSTGVYNFGPGTCNETRTGLTSGNSYTSNTTAAIRSDAGGSGLSTIANEVKNVTAG